MSAGFTKKILIAAIILIFLTGCIKNTERAITDRTGRNVSINGPINRIISTAPSNTEIITDLGMADKLIAIDPYSQNITGIPEGLALIDFSFPDAEAILALRPDIIIANGHNVTGSGEDPFKLLRDMGIAVVYISMSKSISDIYDDIAFVADLLKVKDKGDALISSMKSRITELTEKTSLAAIKTQAKTAPKVYIEISAAPEMVTFGRDSYINDMISAIGAINIFGKDQWIVFPSAESIIERNPDIILTGVDYLDDPVAEIKSRPGFKTINAVSHNRVYRIDTDSLVRPSSRIIQALEQMAAVVWGP